jgi:hypothetical protein
LESVADKKAKNTDRALAFAISFAAFLLSTASECIAQIPAGNTLWLMGDSGITATGKKLTSWADKSDARIVFLAPSDSNSPTVATASVNGHNTVHFDGVSSYLEGPKIYPVQHDYTISMVIKAGSFVTPNNIVSGINHAIWLNGTTYASAFHGDWRRIESSALPIDTNVWVITLSYDRSSDYATFYINGFFADSNFVGINFDSTTFIGAFQRGNFYNGDIAEIVLYDRVLTRPQRDSLHDYFYNKYAILLPSPQPNPEQTFTIAPARLQFYPRDARDSATVKFAGTLRAKGFDSIVVDMYKDSILLGRASRILHYENVGAPFDFDFRIHAELAEYHFIVWTASSQKDSILTTRDSIICGDTYFICGQSNSVYTNGEETYKNEFCRTFGYNWSQSIRDTLWNIGTATVSDGGPSIGGWGIRLAKAIIENQHIPVAIINGGVGGTKIEQQQRNDVYPLDMRTIYGSMLYRAKKSGLAKYAKAMFWYQGESNTFFLYYSWFKLLYTDWHDDYPGLKKIYVMQIRPGCITGESAALRELERTLPDSLANIVAVSTMAVPEHDGCHYRINGYQELGNQVYRLIDRDFYRSTDTAGIGGPNIKKAFYTDPSRKSVAIVFKEKGEAIVIPHDTIVGGINASIKDYFYLGSDTGAVASMSSNHDTLFLLLKSASYPTYISYLPDMYYNSTKVIYEGPWVTNERGIGAFSFWHVPILLSGDLDPTDPGPLFLWWIHPNPAYNEHQIITISLDKPDNIDLRLYDTKGSKLVSLANGFFAAGNYDFEIPVSFSSNQMIFARLKVGATEQTQKILSIK